MDRNSAKKILIAVMVFYILISVLGVGFLSLSGSIFAKRGEIKFTDHIKSLFSLGEDELEETEEEYDPGNKLEGLDALNTPKEEPASGPMTPAEPEPVEAPEEVPSEPEPDILPEEVSEPEEEPEPVPEEHYYSFKSNNTDTRLRMREEPDESSRIVYELKPGTTGYVIELGDEWSKVSAYGNKGYCANEFLTMTEISKEEYDELVKKTDEAKSSTTKKTSASSTVDPAVQAALDAAALASVQTQASDAGAPPANADAQAGTGTAEAVPDAP